MKFKEQLENDYRTRAREKRRTAARRFSAAVKAARMASGFTNEGVRASDGLAWMGRIGRKRRQ